MDLALLVAYSSINYDCLSSMAIFEERTEHYEEDKPLERATKTATLTTII